MEKRGWLEAIFTTYPRIKLRNENGVPASKIHCDWLLETAMLAANRYGLQPNRWKALDTFKVRHHDSWLSRHTPECDVFVALSGSGPVVGPLVQSRGGAWICDRGSTHIVWQARELAAEYARWGVEFPLIHQIHIDRECEEYHHADRLVVPSNFTKRSYVEMGVPQEKLSVIPYGANLSRFSPHGAPPEDEFVILVVGQFGLRKGAPYLLEAFKRFRHPRKRLKVIGSVTSEMRGIMSRFALDRVEFVGTVANEGLARHYSSAHVLILPSVEDGFGMVMGEALACGCPVIATENTVAENLFSNGREGFVIKVRDIDAIVDRLDILASDKELRQRMSAAAVERVRSVGGWDEYGELYANVVDLIAAKNTPSSDPKTTS